MDDYPEGNRRTFKQNNIEFKSLPLYSLQIALIGEW